MAEARPAARVAPGSDWLRLLARISRRLTAAPSNEALAGILVELLAESFDFESVSFYELDGDGEVARLRACAGRGRELVAARPELPAGQGVLGRCLRSGSTVVVDDVAADPDHVLVVAEAGSELAVPLLSEGRVVGAINLEARPRGYFGRAAVEVVEAVAALAVVARDTAGLRERRLRRLAAQQAVHRATLDILEARPLESTLAEIAARVRSLCAAHGCGIYLWDPVRRRLRLSVYSGADEVEAGTELRLGDGLAGRAAAAGQSLAVADYATWEGRAVAYEGIPWHSCAAVPLRQRDEVIGVLDVVSGDRRRSFDDEDIALLELLAGPAALAIENARRAEERAGDLGAAAAVARRLFAVVDAQATRHAVCDAALAVIGCQATLLWGTTLEGGLRLLATAGCDFADVVQAPTSESPSMTALRSGRPVDVPDARAGGGISLDLARLTGCSAVLCHPIAGADGPVGVLTAAWRRPGELRSPRAQALISLFAGDAGAALERADLLLRLEHLARCDPLLGIANRRAWDQGLPDAVATAREQGHPLGVAMLDLDLFKLYNDVHGHQSGDALLRAAGAAWEACLEDGELLARYGGEEFAVLLPGCPGDAAVARVERLRAATPAGVTASAGVAVWDGEEDAQALLARADAALSAAKQAGRDRTISAASPAAETGSRPGPSWTRWSGLVPRIVEHGAIRCAYQPMLHLATWLEAHEAGVAPGVGAVAGYEALPRPLELDPEREADGLFAAAQHRGLGRELDWIYRRAAIAGAARLPAGRALHLNVGLPTLLDPDHGVDELVLLLEAGGRSPGDVVLEVTEREAMRDAARLSAVLDDHRGAGMRVAVDDVGEGHSTLEVLAAARPELIKVARRLWAQGSQPGGRAALRAVVAFAGGTGARVVALGVDSVEEARHLCALGVELGQGRALGRPAWEPWSPPGGAGSAGRLRGRRRGT